MITVTATGSLTDDLAGLVRRMEQANRAVGNRIATVVKREIPARSTVKKLSGMNAKLGVKTKVFAGAQTVTVDVQASPAGPWSIAESGRKGGYTVRPRHKRAVTAPTPFASVTVKRRVTGRQVWSRAVTAATPTVDREIQDVFDDAMTDR